MDCERRLHQVNFLLLAERIRYISFIIFTLSIFLLGSDTNYPLLGVGIRKISLVVFGAISIVIYVSKKNKNKQINSLRICLFLFFIFVWIVFIPILNRTAMRYAFSDSMPLIALGLFLISADFSKKINQWKKIRIFFVWSVAGLILLHVIPYGISFLDPAMTLYIGQLLMNFWGIPGDETRQFVYFGLLNHETIRIYFATSFFLLLALYLFVQKYDNLILNRRFFHFFFFISLLIAIWSTRTRSIMLGAAIFLILSILFDKLRIRVRRSQVTIFVFLILPFIFGFFLLPMINPSILAVFGVGRAVSDNLRSGQFWPLMISFLDHPVFGRGFGAGVSIVRLAAAPYAYELSILALFMKIGFLGLCFGCFILSSSMNAVASREIHIIPKKIGVLYCLYFSYVISCVFNPYMFGLFGTYFALFMLYEYVCLMEYAEMNDDLIDLERRRYLGDFI